MNTIDVKIIIAKQTNVKKGWAGFDNGSPFTRVWLVKSGSSAWIKIKNQKKMPLKAGHLYIIPEETIFEYSTELPVLIDWCHLQFAAFGLHNALRYFNIPLCQKINKDNSAKISKALFELADNLNEKTIRQSIVYHRSKWQLLELLFPKKMEFNSAEGLGITRLEPVLKFMRETISSPLTIEELAKTAHLSTTYFSTYFKKVYGVSPIQYYHQLRCETAQWMLTNQKLTLEEIAQELGYVDAFHFSKTFKRIIGVSPKVYRQMELHSNP